MLRNLLFNVRMSFRMWMRNRTRPVTVEEAEEKKLFWAKAYGLCGIIIFLFVTVSSLDSGSTEFTKSLPIHTKLVENLEENEKIRVIKYSGFTKTTDILMTKEDAYQLKDSEREASRNKSGKIN